MATRWVSWLRRSALETVARKRDYEQEHEQDHESLPGGDGFSGKGIEDEGADDLFTDL